MRPFIIKFQYLLILLLSASNLNALTPINDWSDVCVACVGLPGQLPIPSKLISNFDSLPYNRNALGYYWNCYNDAPNRIPAVSSATQFSAITGGATITPDLIASPILNLNPSAMSPLHGYNNTNGAYIQFTLGPIFAKTAGDATLTKPFVGIGTGLCSEMTQTDFYNAQADSVIGIYFDYKLSGANLTTYVRLEVYDTTIFAGGAVHYLNLPTTSGAWKSATIPFSKLVLPEWNGVITSTPLNETALVKLQWTVQDVSGTSGELAIDNVYFLISPNGFPVAIKPINSHGNPAKVIHNFSTSIINGILRVTIPQEISNASFSLINTRGAIVLKSLPGVNHTSQLNVSGLAKGVYMLNVKAVKSGEAFNNSTPVTLF
jgi:Carbohydrate binding domain (family 11)